MSVHSTSISHASLYFLFFFVCHWSLCLNVTDRLIENLKLIKLFRMSHCALELLTALRYTNLFWFELT